MNPILKKIVETGCTKAPNGESVKIHSDISPEKGLCLKMLISMFKPTVTLEVGLAFGISALYICDALEKKFDTRHIVIDPNQYGSLLENKWMGCGIYNLREAGYESIVEYMDIPSYQALPKLKMEGRKIDLAFIDGWHTFDYAMVDFFYIDKMLNVGGIVIFDDADFPSIRKLCRYMSTNLSYEVITIPNEKKVKTSIRRHIANMLFTIPGTAKFFKQFVKPELAKSDTALGLTGGLIAFRKNSEDSRSWSFHKEF